MQGWLRESSASGGGKSLYLLSNTSKTLSGVMDTAQGRLSQNGINKEKPSALLKNLKTTTIKKKKAREIFSQQRTSSACVRIGIGQAAPTRKKNYTTIEAGIGSRP